MQHGSLSLSGRLSSDTVQVNLHFRDLRNTSVRFQNVLFTRSNASLSIAGDIDNR